MAANNYITVDTSKSLGAKVFNLQNNIENAMALATELAAALAQVNADGVAALQGQLGTTSTDNASAVLNLIGSVNANLQDAGNAFLQLQSRIGRP